MIVHRRCHAEPAEENDTDERGLARLGGGGRATAVGDWFGTGSTTMFTVAEPVAPSLSVTVRVTGWVPTAGEGEAGLPASVEVWPPPKFHR